MRVPVAPSCPAHLTAPPVPWNFPCMRAAGAAPLLSRATYSAFSQKQSVTSEPSTSLPQRISPDFRVLSFGRVLDFRYRFSTWPRTVDPVFVVRQVSIVPREKRTTDHESRSSGTFEPSYLYDRTKETNRCRSRVTFCLFVSCFQRANESALSLERFSGVVRSGNRKSSTACHEEYRESSQPERYRAIAAR